MRRVFFFGLAAEEIMGMNNLLLIEKLKAEVWPLDFDSGNQYNLTTLKFALSGRLQAFAAYSAISGSG
jgi:hypothetical protein